MIRINLLGLPRPKKGKRGGAAVPAVAGEGPNPLVLGVIVALLFAIGNYWYYSRLQSEAKQLKDDTQKAESENRRLSEVKAKYLQAQRTKDDYKRRVDVIDQLRANQSGPVNLLSMVGETIDKTDAVWLSTLKDDGKSINVEGTALSVNAVANLAQNLTKSGYFKSVEIKDAHQDESVKDMTAFNFTLVCEKKS